MTTVSPNGRSFAWVDDEQSDLDDVYVTAHHRGPGLLHHVNPRIGLREDDFRTLAGFADSQVARSGSTEATGTQGK